MMFIESYEILAKKRTHYPLVMTNSSPWYSWPIEIDGLPGFTCWKWWFSTAMLNNQMVKPTKSIDAFPFPCSITRGQFLWGSLRQFLVNQLVKMKKYFDIFDLGKSFAPGKNHIDVVFVDITLMYPYCIIHVCQYFDIPYWIKIPWGTFIGYPRFTGFRWLAWSDLKILFETKPHCSHWIYPLVI